MLTPWYSSSFSTESKITLSNELVVQEMEKPPSPFLLWESSPYTGGIFKDKSASLTFHCAWNEFSRPGNTTLSLKSLLLVCWVPKRPGRKKKVFCRNYLAFILQENIKVWVLFFVIVLFYYLSFPETCFQLNISARLWNILSKITKRTALWKCILMELHFQDASKLKAVEIFSAIKQIVWKGWFPLASWVL